jgi:3-hydroxybutyryl-CoA dehydratase
MITSAADLRYEDLEIGMKRSFRRFVSEEDVDTFGILSGDLSPLHTDHQYAAGQAGYRKRLIHGMHLASLISCLVGMHLPGFRSVCLAQQFDFINPAYADSELEIIGEIGAKNDATRTVTVRTRVLAADGKVLLSGKATVKILDSEWPAAARS